MQKSEYLQVRVEVSQDRLVAIANGKEVIRVNESAGEVDIIKYLNSLGMDGWEMFSAQKQEYGYRIIFFKLTIEQS